MVMMYKIADIVVYENCYICIVKDITKLDFANTDEKYYKLESMDDNRNTYYVKLKNEQSLRYTITKDEATNYIHQIKNVDIIYNDNSKLRDKEFSEVFKKGEWISYLRMYKGLMLNRKKKNFEGKQLNTNDNRNLNKIDKIICDECSIALKMSQDDVRQLFISHSDFDA